MRRFKKTKIFRKTQYWFDSFMSRGTPALIAGLFALSTIWVLGVALVLVKVHEIVVPESQRALGPVWVSMVHALDPGAISSDSGCFAFRLLMLVATLGGIFIVSLLIGIINNGLHQRLKDLRKGRSLVLEREHTLILGWTPQVFTIVSELVVANENRRRGAVVVVMADKDKVEMEDAIRYRIPDTKNTRVICRSGNALDLADLEIVSPNTARSIIVLPDGEAPDIHAIKVVLAIVNHPRRREAPYHIVTELRDSKNRAVLEMLTKKDRVLPVLVDELVARIIAQTARQSGLPVVYTELVNYGGDEIYFKGEPALVGKTYGEALSAYDRCSPIGIGNADGQIKLNPPMDLEIGPGDQICVITEDDDRISLSPTDRASIQPGMIRTSSAPAPAKPENILILGWNGSANIVVRELDQYVAAGSQVTVMSTEANGLDRYGRDLLSGRFGHETLSLVEKDPCDRTQLDELDIPGYDHVIVLANRRVEVQKADAATLITLLHLRDIAEKGNAKFSIVSEMLDLRNRELAEALIVDDFVVSEHFISLLMTQLSEDHRLYKVFNEIFDADGAEIYLKPAGDYVATGSPVPFLAVVEAARQRQETAIGYRLASEARKNTASHGVHVNPPKSSLLVFSPDDKVIVVAES